VRHQLKCLAKKTIKDAAEAAATAEAAAGTSKEKTTKLSDQYRTVSFTPGYDEKDFPIFLTSMVDL